MNCYIVPNHVRDAINEALDRELAKCPDAAPDRELFYYKLLVYFDEHGVVPEFSFERRTESD